MRLDGGLCGSLAGPLKQHLSGYVTRGRIPLSRCVANIMISSSIAESAGRKGDSKVDP